MEPLILYSILDLKDLFTCILFQIYILKRKAEGKLARPWMRASLFAELLKMVEREKVEHAEFEKVTTEELESRSAEEPLLRTRARRIRFIFSE